MSDSDRTPSAAQDRSDLPVEAHDADCPCESCEEFERLKATYTFPDGWAEKCTCTIACIPQGITSEQTCKLQIETER